MHAVIPILFRWLHIVSACLAVGGTFFIRIMLPIGLKDLDIETRRVTFLRFRRVFKMLIHTCILLLIVSGVYNSMGNWAAYNEIPSKAQALWGTHVLLGVAIMGIAIYVLAGKEPKQNRATWMAVNLLLMAATLGVAAALKYVRDNRPRLQPTPNMNSTSTAAPSGSALTPTAARA